MHDQEVDENERDESQGKVPRHHRVDDDGADTRQPIVQETLQSVSKKLLLQGHRKKQTSKCHIPFLLMPTDSYLTKMVPEFTSLPASIWLHWLQWGRNKMAAP